MKKVKIVTRAREYVAEVDVLPFQPPPDILVWGERFFQRITDVCYCESFAYFIPPEAA
jgi:hypothetical protein